MLSNVRFYGYHHGSKPQKLVIAPNELPPHLEFVEVKKALSQEPKVLAQSLGEWVFNELNRIKCSKGAGDKPVVTIQTVSSNPLKDKSRVVAFLNTLV